MNYPEAIAFLFDALPVWERSPDAYKPGLERISAFAEMLGDPQRSFAAVHVAGTNGKGSTCHMLAAVLQAAGYRTGLFTSPHLVDFRERIRVDGAMIPQEAVVEFTSRWRDGMVRSGLSFFEMATAMGLWWFSRSGCDIAVIETGLGGRLDSTNIVVPAVSVITNIGLEHTKYLGDTIAAIAAEKAGIIKPGVPVVVGESDPQSAPVFRAAAAQLGSEIDFAAEGRSLGVRSVPDTSTAVTTPGVIFADRQKVTENYTLDLAGDHQQKNLRTVLATVEVLRRRGFEISDGALRCGLAHAAAMTGLQGRWQVVRREPLVVLDTAHNAHGLAGVMRQIERERALQRRDKLFMVLGFAADKDLETILPLLPARARYILTAPDTPRAMPAGELARRFSAVRPGRIKSVPSVAEALERALEQAGPCDMVFAGGSNFVVAEALQALDC